VAVRSDRPYSSLDFRVRLGQGDRGALGFSRVEFPDFGDTPAEPGTEGSVLPARSTLLLTRGFDGDLTVYNWWNRTRSSKRPRGRTLRIELLGEHQRVAVAWTFSGCRPIRLSYSPLDALVPAVLLETLELAFERVEME
jgi:phage tail-like protein